MFLDPERTAVVGVDMQDGFCYPKASLYRNSAVVIASSRYAAHGFWRSENDTHGSRRF
jgi:nicotinamidase-related amidase